MLDRAIALDPNYAHAHAWRACTLGQAWVHGWCTDRDAVWNEVVAGLQAALVLDDNDSDVHRVLAAVDVARDDLEKAMYHQARALSLNPNDDLIVVQQGEILTWLGQPEEGIDWIKKAMRLNPYHPERFWSHLARAHFVARQHAEAVGACRRIASPDYSLHALLAACHAHLGNEAAARLCAQEVLNLKADFHTGEFLTTQHYKRDGDREHHREGLLKAGLPE
jgi:adenylate cyclase